MMTPPLAGTGEGGFTQRKHRLHLTQQTLSENLNIPMRCLRGDALEALRGLVGESVFAVIEEKVAEPVPLHPLGEKLTPELVGALSPPERVQHAQTSVALWLTPRSAGNSFYDELKNSIPTIQALLRLNILRVLQRLKADPTTGENSLTLPAGLVGIFNRLPERPGGAPRDDYLITGPTRLLAGDETERTPDSASRAITMERQARAAVEEVGRIKGEEFDPEVQTNLLVLSTAYVEPCRRVLELKAETALRVLAQAFELEAAHADLVDHLSTLEWCRAVQFLFFWQSRRTLPLLEHYLKPGGLGHKVPLFRAPTLGFQAEDNLSGAMGALGRRWAIRARGEFTGDRAMTLDDLSFALVESEREEPPGQMYLEVGEEAKGEEEEELLRYFYHRTREDSQNSRARQEYLSFDRLRFVLQHLSPEVVGERQRELTRRARSLVAADVAAFFRFDALNDRLQLAAVHASPWVEETGEAFFNQWLTEVADDPRRRPKSVLYRCADTKRFQSKVEISEESHPWGVRLTETVEQLPADREAWGIDAEDVMAAPVQFHGRLQGVLYLMAGTPRRFRYYDRVRVLSYVQMFEAELFRARLFAILREMNQQFSRALHGDIDERSFCNGLMEQLGGLIAVPGAVLWWRSPSAKTRFRVLGHAGAQIVGLVTSGIEAPLDEFPFSEYRGDLQAMPLTFDGECNGRIGGLRNLPWKFFICLPLTDLANREIVGAVTLHQLKRFGVSRFLDDELRFLRNELRQTLEGYLTQRRRLGDLRAMIGHEVQSALDHIAGRSERLARLVHDVGGSLAEQAELSLRDLNRSVQRARRFLDFLTMEAPEWATKHIGEDPLFWPYRLLSRKLSEPLSIHEAVITALHGRIHELRKREITFEFSGKKPPPLWLGPGEVDTIFTNLVDNVVKYGKPGSRIVVEYDRDDLEFFVKFRCTGVYLREDLRDSPTKILDEKVRGLPPEGPKLLGREDSPPGTGKGLWMARQMVLLWDGEIKLNYNHLEPWAEYEFVLSFPRWLMGPENPWPARL